MVRGELPWDKAWIAHFSAFAEHFSLHDSRWIGVFIPGAEVNEAILAMEWDTFWLPEPLRTECMNDKFGPILFMRVSGLHHLQLFEFDKTSCGGKEISAAEHSFHEGIKGLEIFNACGGIVRLEYTGKVEFLALGRKDNRSLNLAMVEPRHEPAIEKKPWWK